MGILDCAVTLESSWYELGSQQKTWMYLNEHLFRAGYMINVSSVLSQNAREAHCFSYNVLVIRLKVRFRLGFAYKIFMWFVANRVLFVCDGAMTVFFFAIQTGDSCGIHTGYHSDSSSWLRSILGVIIEGSWCFFTNWTTAFFRASSYMISRVLCSRQSQICGIKSS